MSWNLSIRSVSKTDAPAVIDALDFSENDVAAKPQEVVTSMRTQLAAGKVAAKAALAAFAGPNVSGSIWGHAGGGSPDNVGCSVNSSQ